MKTVTALLHAEKAGVKALKVGRLVVRDESESCSRVICETDSFYEKETKGGKAIFTKMDFLFETEAAFDWFHSIIEEGAFVNIRSQEPYIVNLDEYYEVVSIDRDGDISMVPEQFRDDVFAALYNPEDMSG